MDQRDAPARYKMMVKKQLAPMLLGKGFKRSASTFRRYFGNGDVSIIELQRSSGSWQQEYIFYANLATATGNWLEYMASRGYHKALTAPGASLGQTWTRLPSISPHSENVDSWRVRDDERSAGCGAVLIHAIETTALPEFDIWAGYYSAVENAVLARKGAQDLLAEPPPLRAQCSFRDPDSDYVFWLRRNRTGAAGKV